MGIAVSNNLLNDQSYLTLNYGTVKRGVFTPGSDIYDCTKQVYASLNENHINTIPDDLSIMCFKIPYDRFSEGNYPYFKLGQCMNSTTEVRNTGPKTNINPKKDPNAKPICKT
jgi:hypothetical protein